MVFFPGRLQYPLENHDIYLYIYIYPLKNDGWKMKCLFENGPFSGRNHLNFSGGGNQFNLMKGSQLQNTFMHEITGVGVVFFGIPRGQCPR